MKKYTLYISVIFLISSCVEVVHLKHDDSDPVLIVDGRVTDQPGPYSVKLSTTISFNSSDRSLAVDDAIVTISDDLGNSEELSLTEMGVYQTSSIQGVIGRTYFLNIEYAGKTYTSQSDLLPVNDIDTLKYAFQNKTALTDEGYFVSLAVSVDNPENINYYRWKVYENDSLYNGKEDIVVADDDYTEGEFEFQFDYPFEVRDTVRIEMASLNKDALDYYNGFIEVLTSDGGLFSPPPVNAPSNISNGALGLFQASAVVTKELVIQE